MTEFSTEDKRTLGDDDRVPLGIAFTQDLQGRLPLFIAAGSSDVEIAPVGGNLGPELGRPTKPSRRRTHLLVTDEPFPRHSARCAPWTGYSDGRGPVRTRVGTPRWSASSRNSEPLSVCHSTLLKSTPRALTRSANSDAQLSSTASRRYVARIPLMPTNCASCRDQLEQVRLAACRS